MSVFTSDRGRTHRLAIEVESLEVRRLLSTLQVDDDRAQCPDADFTSIQAAVLAAHPGDTIKVCPGTYNESVQVPAGKDNLKLISEKHWAAVINAPADQAVHDAGAKNLTLRGFTLTTAGGASYGVLVDGGGSATIQDNHVTGATPTTGFFVGVSVEGTGGYALVRDNLVDRYRKDGIVADGANSAADVITNVVIGAGTAATEVQNGIQLSNGATGTVVRNFVSNNLYAPQTFGATGIFVLQSGKVTVSQNVVYRNDENLVVDTIAAPGGPVVVERNDSSGATFDGIDVFNSTDRVVISDNRAHHNDYEGIGVYDSSGVVVSKNEADHNGQAGDPAAGDGIGLFNSTGVRVEKNYAHDNALDGVFVDSLSTNNVLVKNRMFDNGLFDAEDESHGAGTAGTANYWIDNQCETANPPGICDHAHGNGHGNGHGHGHGDHDHDRRPGRDDRD